jgi:hypothetical protein
MTGLRGKMSRDHRVGRLRRELCRDQRGSGRDEAVEDDDLVVGRASQTDTAKDGELGATERCQSSERIVSPHLVHGQRPRDNTYLAAETRIVDAGAATADALGLYAEQCRAEGRRDGAVPDPHLAEGQDAHVLARELLGEQDAFISQAPSLVTRHGRAGGDVPRRPADARVDHTQLGSGRPREHADRSATRLEVPEHLSRDLLRVRAHCLGRDPVIAGGNDDGRSESAGRRGVSDPGNPLRNLLEPAQTPAGLRLRVERARRLLARVRIGGPDA